MHRRAFLKTGGSAALVAAIGGCAGRASAMTSPLVGPRRARLNLVPADVAMDRIIRTTVGLRPHRDSGFVLRAEQLDAKMLIHNYGHAGAGMSLAWGCGVMVAEL